MSLGCAGERRVATTHLAKDAVSDGALPLSAMHCDNGGQICMCSPMTNNIAANSTTAEAGRSFSHSASRALTAAV